MNTSLLRTLALVLLTACPKTPVVQPDAGILLPPRCQAGEEWDDATPAFVDQTERWGFADLVIKGTRINVLDVDGDGFPDLLVRNGDGPDDFGPEGTRQRWLLRNTGAGRFEDITEQSGLFTDRAGTPGALTGSVLVAGDINNDGHTDVFIASPSNDGSRTSEVKLGKGDGTFDLGPESSAARRDGQPSVPAGLSLTDVDRDGQLDLWMTQNKLSTQNSPLPDDLYLGRGDGAFDRAGASMGISSLYWNRASTEQLNNGEGNSWSWGATACDLDSNGVPELMSPAYGRSPNHLWLGEDTGVSARYTNHSVASGYAYDDNLDWSDNESARCWCKLNPNSEGCAGVPAPRVRCTQASDILRWNHSTDREPWRLAGNSGGTVCGDINNDGHMDLLTSEIVHWDVGANSDAAEVLLNTGESPLRFTRPGNTALGLARRKPSGSWDEGIITGNLLDFDNDAWPDVYFGGTDYATNRALLYRQTRPGEFAKVRSSVGIDRLRAHGSAVADFDRDGDLDMIVGHSRMRCGNTGECLSPPVLGFFENQLGQATNWVQFTLQGADRTNRWAVGAQVKVQADGTTQMQELGAGQGHYGNQNDRLMHFGLGTACTAEVEIRWPDADLSTQKVRLQSGYRYLIVQGAEPVAQN